MKLNKVSWTFNSLLGDTREAIRSFGFVQHDNRFNRTVYAVTGYAVFVKREVLLEMMEYKPLEKYKEDCDRMEPSFILACEEIKRDPDSRQAVILNTADYDTVHQCFQLIQFVRETDGFGAIVYQRSGDVDKMKDDYVFFGSIIKQFEEETNHKVYQCTVVYGNLHTEK